MTADPLCTDASDDHRHSVVLYRREDQLLAAAVEWFEQALRQDHAVVVIATDDHHAAFLAALGERLDVAAAIANGRLITRDAAATLAGFMVDGHPDRQRLDATVGQTIREALATAPGLSAFGEMVALLWRDGMPDAALELEQLWEELQQRYHFPLLCAYPALTVVTEDDASGYVAVAGAHQTVECGAPQATDAEVARHFPAHFGAPRLVRQFVRETLAAWGLSDLNDDAALVASELATNAVRHAASDFALSLGRSSRGLRLAVGDNVAAFPASPEADLVRSDGRGLHLVARTAQAWGHQRVDNGKLVWAEIDRR